MFPSSRPAAPAVGRSYEAFECKEALFGNGSIKKLIQYSAFLDCGLSKQALALIPGFLQHFRGRIILGEGNGKNSTEVQVLESVLRQSSYRFCGDSFTPIVSTEPIAYLC